MTDTLVSVFLAPFRSLQKKGALRLLIGFTLASVNLSAGAAESDNSPRIDTIFLVDISRSMTSSLYEALKDNGYAREDGKDDRRVPYFAMRPEKEAQTLTFLAEGIKSRPLVEKYMPEWLLAEKKANRKVTENILFQSVRSIEQIVDGYPRGKVTIIPFITGPVVLNAERMPRGRVEFDIEGTVDEKRDRRVDILRFLNRTAYDKSSKFPAWRGLIEEALYYTDGQKQPKKIALSISPVLEEMRQRIERTPKKDYPYSIQLVVFTDGDEQGRSSQLESFLAECQGFRAFAEQNGIWFEYREHALGRSDKLPANVGQTHSLIEKRGFLASTSSSFPRRTRLSSIQDAIWLEIEEPEKAYLPLAPVKAKLQMSLAADDAKYIDGTVTFSIRSPSTTATSLKLRFAGGQTAPFTLSSSSIKEFPLEFVIDDPKNQLFGSASSVPLLDGFRLGWTFTATGETRSDDRIPHSVPLKLRGKPIAPRVVKVRLDGIDENGRLPISVHGIKGQPDLVGKLFADFANARPDDWGTVTLTSTPDRFAQFASDNPAAFELRRPPGVSPESSADIVLTTMPNSRTGSLRLTFVPKTPHLVFDPPAINAFVVMKPQRAVEVLWGGQILRKGSAVDGVMLHLPAPSPPSFDPAMPVLAMKIPEFAGETASFSVVLTGNITKCLTLYRTSTKATETSFHGLSTNDRFELRGQPQSQHGLYTGALEVKPDNNTTLLNGSTETLSVPLSITVIGSK